MIVFALFASLFSAEFKAYLENCPSGDYKKGEVEIVVGPDKVREIEALQKGRLLKKGVSDSEARQWSAVGLIAEDQYLILYRDAVLFPSGAMGTYDRLIWKSSLSGPSGVAVLPILPDGRFVLNVNYRHATRAWELELPRGMTQKGESPEIAAQRELQEETGLLLNKLVPLGMIAPDTGILSSVMPVYAGYVGGAKEAEQEESEAIASIQAFTLAELREALKEGSIQLEPHGKVYVRDSFLTFALFQVMNNGE